MRYLITGGAGFIGSALTRHLLSAGHEVTVLDNMSRGRPGRLEHTGARLITGDVRELQTVVQAAQGCDAIAHLAYMQGTQTFYSEPREVLDVALRGILNVLDACRMTGCGDLLLVSSSEAYQVAPVVPTPEDVPLTVPDPLNSRYSYGGGKIASELAALAWQRAGILDRVVVARPHNIYGPDMGREHVIPEFCLRMNKLTETAPAWGVETGQPLPFPIQGSGQETRSFCWIGDCVEQLAFLLGCAPPGPGIWNVGTMDEHTIARIAEEVAIRYGRDIKLEPGKLPQGSPPRRLPDTSKIWDLAHQLGRGWTETSLGYGLDVTVDWYQHHG